MWPLTNIDLHRPAHTLRIAVYSSQDPIADTWLPAGSSACAMITVSGDFVKTIQQVAHAHGRPHKSPLCQFLMLG